MGEANFYYFTCLNFNYLRRWCPFEGPSNAKMGSHKTLKIKKVLAKKQKQQADSSVDPDANRQHDSLQRQETSLEENQAQALNSSSMSFARDSCFSSMGLQYDFGGLVGYT